MTDIKRYPLESLLDRILSPFEAFLQQTTAGGIILITATIIALVLATWLGAGAVHHFWGQQLAISAGNCFELTLSWHYWVNDGLMALFFLLVGLELKREILVGELASLKDAALPIMAAVGGMMIPASIYAAFNVNTPTASGWGIPMATDIAFAIGILVLLGERIPKNLIIFLMALAIADDLGAVLVIALFYTSTLNINALVVASMLLALLLLFNRAGIRHLLPYALVGAALWYAMLISGVHATVAGILLAITIPARAAYRPQDFHQQIKELNAAFGEERDADTPDELLINHRLASIAAAMKHRASAALSPLQRMEHSLSPWVTFIIIPVFALSNAGIDLTGIEWKNALSEKATLGVMFGLVVGKFVGISLFSWIAVSSGLGRLPTGVAWRHLFGAAWLGGIGFTMSLFIGQLAFVDPLYIEQAKLGILLASVISAAFGLVWLSSLAREKRVVDRQGGGRIDESGGCHEPASKGAVDRRCEQHDRPMATRAATITASRPKVEKNSLRHHDS
jgi:NhaA family Na+:H+ antiporter